jgi:hypothetical protein
MKDDERPSNVVDLLKKPSAPVRPTSAMILESLELVRIFLTIRTAFDRKRVLALAREIAESDANKKA